MSDLEAADRLVAVRSAADPMDVHDVLLLKAIGDLAHMAYSSNSAITAAFLNDAVFHRLGSLLSRTLSVCVAAEWATADPASRPASTP